MVRRFPLAGLLRLRKLQEDEAAADLARSHAERRRAENRRDQLAEMLAGAALPHRGDELMWRAAIAGRAALNAMVTDSATTLEVADNRVEEATGLWSAARAQTSTLEKLEDRHETGVRAEDDRAEQLLLDEAAARGHLGAGTPEDVAEHEETPRSITPEEDR